MEKLLNRSIIFNKNIAIILFLIIQAWFALSYGLPGQLSVDSLIQLYEGRFGQSISFNPPFMSALLGWLDKLGNAPISFVLIMQAFFSISIWLVLSSQTKIQPFRLCLAMLVLTNPIIALYTGIVWKDVLLAHSVLLMYLYINHLHLKNINVNLFHIVISLGLMTVTVGSRQQGILFLIPAAVWLSVISSSRIASKFCRLAIFIIIPLVLNFLISKTLEVSKQVDDRPTEYVGVQIAIHYDLVGILAHQGNLAKGTSPLLINELEAEIPLYSPYRVDTLPVWTSQYLLMPFMNKVKLWYSTIVENPIAYFSHRGDHFSTLLGFNDTRLCLPVFSGVNQFYHRVINAELATILGITPGDYSYSQDIKSFGQSYANTPLFSLWFYSLICIIVSIILIKRNEYILATFGFTSLAFLASYLIIGIACDFRYGYTLTLTSVTLLAYCILSPKVIFNPARFKILS